MSLVLNAAATCPIFAPRSARAHCLQPPVQLGFTLSQRSFELASMQLWCRNNKQRVQLLCCSSCHMSILAVRLARAVDSSAGSRSLEHLVASRIVKFCFSAFALRALREVKWGRNPCCVIFCCFDLLVATAYSPSTAALRHLPAAAAMRLRTQWRDA